MTHIQQQTPGKIFIVSAPSGAGKTTVVHAVVSELQKKYSFKRCITYTTRPMRSGEVQQEDYIFISKEAFEHYIKEDFFIEYSTWYDYYYGTPKTILTDVALGQNYIIILDRPGAMEFKRAYPDVILIWMEPVSLSALRQRLMNRGTDSLETIERRLKKARIEMEEEKKEKWYDFHVINDVFEDTVEKMINCILGQMLKK